ncbi:uncharacterized protein LOC126458273 isoform X2 [Schistocerca serialis cubense]|uniref:uncharacterized protein LOC126458273 isoform X2 n=1 Tax=Schistocerca serialis cubense TaxID=2023355 RepID=UPI00214E50C0|nr:uncharacterized protein LOC126458273 isoform X2 [Schistocerca serialis cubense]XP_049951158.1 uncharacterized protein LOC126458273 isoform X2 [Schistocerca serialis cubense]
MDKENQINVAAIKCGILEIETEAIKQHAKLIQLRHENNNLQAELEKVGAELQKTKQMKLTLEGDLQYQQMRLSELERQQVSREKSLQQSRAEAQELRVQMKTERAVQIEKLKPISIWQHWIQLAAAVHLRDEHEDRDVISKEVAIMEMRETELKDGIQNIQGEIHALKENWALSGDRNLSALENVSSFLTKDTQAIQTETERLEKQFLELMEEEKELDSELEIMQRRN